MLLSAKLDMKSKIFEVKIYHSGFCIHQVKAKTEGEAIKKAREFSINENEILNNLENWKDADNAEEIKKYEKTTSKIPFNYKTIKVKLCNR